MNTHLCIIQLQLLSTHELACFFSVLVHYLTFFSTAFLEANSRHHTIVSVTTSDCISKRPFRHVVDVLMSDQQFLVALWKERSY